jgi:hypothetical protein
VVSPWYETATADGSIVSTAADLCAYARLLLARGAAPEGRLFSEDSWERLTQRAIEDPDEPGAWYGYGLMTREKDGRTLIGQTIEDLVRWEDWLAEAKGIKTLDVAGISYGGDLAVTYPAFSARARRIYTSGSMGSFAAVFARCYNAPAHCIPGVLQWMDRSDIAGLNAPRPIRLHYGELDKPGPDNASAAHNETVAPALAELRAIYRAFGAEDRVSLHVTPGRGHEMDNDDLLAFLAG